MKLIIIIIAIIAVCYFYNKNKKASSIPKSNSKNVVSNIPIQENIVRCCINGRYDEDGTVCRYKNGQVYCLSKHGEYLLGTYSEEKHGELTVRCVSDNEVIGYVRGNKIVLTRAGQFNRFEKMGYPKQAPIPIETICAERFSNCICELNGGDVVALCEKDCMETGAAFICMHYEAASAMNSQFHSFWNTWL